MPFIKEVVRRKVVRIGFLDTPFEEMTPSRDAFGIPVTVDPEQFRRAFSSNGPEFRLTSPTAIWVAASQFDQTSMQELADWMIAREYMRPCTTYTAFVFDEALDDFTEKAFSSLKEAAAAAGRSEEQELKAQAEGDGAVEISEGFALTPATLKKLGGANVWHDKLDWYNAAVLLYVRYVVIPKRPFIVGVWWDDAEGKGSAPYGVLFPERASSFLVEDEEGNIAPFWEAFPNCPGQDFDARNTPEIRAQEAAIAKTLQSAGIDLPPQRKH